MFSVVQQNYCSDLQRRNISALLKKRKALPSGLNRAEKIDYDAYYLIYITHADLGLRAEFQFIFIWNTFCVIVTCGHFFSLMLSL